MFNSYQEAFDATVEGLATQGKRSYDEETEMCRYLDHSGNRCAVGLHIPTGHPAQKVAADVYDMLTKYPDITKNFQIKGVFDDATLVFWLELQYAHDHADSLQAVKSKFTNIAIDYNLDPSKVNMFTVWK